MLIDQTKINLEGDINVYKSPFHTPVINVEEREV